jgi:PGF-pre-PGF domain-containing protein
MNDSWGNGWCEEVGCWNYWNNGTACALDATCQWKNETFCEEARCWLFDFTNASTCENNTYGLTCDWEDPSWCYESYHHETCSQHDGNAKGCKDTGYCWWDPDGDGGNGTCDDPAGDWAIQWEEDQVNPGCWMFDYQYSDCKNVSGCSWNNATSECNGLEEAGVQCSSIKNRDMCDAVSVLDTCCVWKNSKCEADKGSTKCQENMQPPPEGATYCGDTNAYTSEAMCKKIMADPWYMPCKWDSFNTSDTSDDRCVFRSEDKFGGEAGGCAMITSKKDCDFAGCEWKAESYCNGTKSVPFGWCEEKTGSGSTTCAAACWACDSSSSCESNDNCEWNTTKSKCTISADEKKDSPKSACEQSAADCKWVADTSSGFTASGGLNGTKGWCYPKSQEGCAENCFKCYNNVSCVNYGSGAKDSCEWKNDICMPSQFDKEICFDGEDNDNDGMVDCEDNDCLKDSFCGAGFMSSCWKYETKSKCDTQGIADECIWISDPSTGSAWCGSKGEKCFQWDGNEGGCNNQTGICQWYPDPWGGFCDLNSSKKSACDKLKTQKMCTSNKDCGWTPSTNLYGGVCEARVLACEGKTKSACDSDDWCTWGVNPDTELTECMPICFSKNQNSQSTCGQNTNCEWMGGICDPADALGMKMEDCWKYDDDQSACSQTAACEWTEELFGGFCDLNKSVFKTCMGINLTACYGAPECKWNGDNATGWCDPKIFSCGWYQTEGECNADANSYGGCAWIDDSFGPGPGGPRCEPICFNETTNAGCDSHGDTCEMRYGFCEPKMAKQMFQGMDSPPVILAGDNCPEGTIPNRSDICGFGVKETPDNFAFGISVVSMVDSAICNGEKVVSSGQNPTVLASSGKGTNTTKFFVYLDTDGVKNNSCSVHSNSSNKGYEFFLSYVTKWVEGDSKETRNSMRCENGQWVIVDIMLTGWNKLMCAEIGGGMIAVDKGDLTKFPKLYKSDKNMRVFVATAGAGTGKTNPLDKAGPARYKKGTADFKFEDCMTPGVDMDGDGLKSENDPDCFLFKQQGFIRFEDCFAGTGDEDNDGLSNCDDPDCKYSPGCEDTGVNAQGYEDTDAPGLMWHEVEKFPDAAFIKYDSNEPANGTVRFYQNDSSCTNVNKTIYDIGILDKFIPKYKSWHDAPVDNFTWNSQRLNKSLNNGTAYYYKIKLCDPDNNCAESACLSFTTAKSDSKRNCPDCYQLFKFEGLGGLEIDTGAGFNSSGSCESGGFMVNYKESKDLSADIKMKPTDNTTNASIVFEGATLTGLSTTVTVDSGTYSGSDYDPLGYVGLNSSTFDNIAGKLRPKNCTLTIPKGQSSDNCSEVKYCKDPVNGVVDPGTCTPMAASSVTVINDTNAACVVKVPCEFSVYGVGGSVISSPTGGGGGGGGAKGELIKEIKAGETGIAKFDLADTIYISQIELTSTETVFNVKVGAEPVEKKPYATMPDPSGAVVSYLKLTKSDISNTQLKEATIKFVVPVSWLKEKNVAYDTVMLRRDVGKWEDLPTEFLTQDANYAYFSAVTPGLSYFVITGDEGSGYKEPEVKETIAPETEAPETPAVTEAPAPPETETPLAEKVVKALPTVEPEEEGGSSAIIIVGVMVVIAAAIVVVLKKRGNGGGEV